jgi:hypothetical protein
MGIFNRIEVPMLIDTGSAVSIINEEVWKLLNIRGPLDKVPFTVRSVTQHSIKIIGQKDIHFYLKPKSKRSFTSSLSLPVLHSQRTIQTSDSWTRLFEEI